MSELDNVYFKLRDSYLHYKIEQNRIVLKSRYVYTVIDCEGTFKEIDGFLRRLLSCNTIKRFLQGASKQEKRKLVLALRKLEKNGIVVMKPMKLDDSLKHNKSQICFFSEYSKDGAPLQKNLQEARVSILGANIFGLTTAKLLVASGFRNVDIYNKTKNSRSNRKAPFTNPSESSEETQLAKELAEAKHQATVSFRQIRDIGELNSDSRCDFLIAWINDVNELLAVNKLCARRTIEWISCRYDGPCMLVGPMVIPGQTPCFECYQRWELANMPSYSSYLDYAGMKAIRRNPAYSCMVPSVYLTASIATTEVILRLTNLVQPNTLGRMLSIDPISASIESHRVLSLPDCKACSEGREKSIAIMGASSGANE
jgi:bacteriocin biosynthesis cyclodehydratase domain-containing protein